MSGTDFPTLYGTDTAWATPAAPFTDILAITGPLLGTAAAALLQRVATMSLDTPVTLAAVLTDDPTNITIINIPRTYTAGVTARPTLDDQVFGFVGTTTGDATPIHLVAAAFQAVNVDGHDDAAVLRTELDTAANVTDGRRNHIAAGQPHAAALTVRRVMLLPVEMAAAVSANITYTPATFYDSIIGPNIGDAAWVASYGELIDWWNCATMMTAAVAGPPAVAAAPALALNTQLALTLPEQRLLNNWGRRTLALLAGAVPPAVAPMVTPLVTAVDSLRTDMNTNNTDRRDAEAEKARLAALPQTFDKRFGRPTCEEVMRYCEVDSMDDLPDLLKTLGTHTRQAADLVAIKTAVDQRAAQTNSPANDWSKPVTDVKLLAIFREHRIVATGDHWGEGLSPFAITTAGNPESRKEANRAQRLNMVERGNMGITYSDTGDFEDFDPRLPADDCQCAEQLEGFSVAIDLYLGVNHRYTIAFRNHLVDLIPFMRSGLRHVYRTDGKGLVLICWRIIYWHQQEFFYFMEQLQKGTLLPPLPEFGRLIKSLRIKNVDGVLPNMPEQWVKVGKGGAKREAAGVDGGVGGSGEPQQKKAKVVKNPHADATLKERFKNSGHKTMILCLKVGQDAGAAMDLPTIGRKEACLNWLIKGECKDTCKRAETHKHAGPTVIEKAHVLLDNCGVARLP